MDIIDASTILKLISSVVCTFCIIGIIRYNWKRRWLYYYSAILPGPLALPIIGCPTVMLSGQEDIFKTVSELINVYPSLFRVWLGRDFYIFTQRAKDIEYILLNSVNKDNSRFHVYLEEIIPSVVSNDSLKWKLHRKSLNPSFSQKMVNSFFDDFVKQANHLVTELDKIVDQEVDVFTILWTSALDIVFETLGRVDPKTLKKSSTEFIPHILRFEKWITERATNVVYASNIVWKFSPGKKKLDASLNTLKEGMKEIIDRHQQVKSESSDATEEKTFLSFAEKGQYDEQEILEELIMMLIAGSESQAITVSSLLLYLSMHPEIQEKLYNELDSVLDSSKKITIGELNQAHFLDRVLKETLRLAPAIPIVSRDLEKTVEIDSQVFPAGCNVAISIFNIHRNPEYWTNPLKFDPDRFLPEEVKKIPRGAYIPFGDGARNCIGSRFAVLSIKVIIAIIVKNFEVIPGCYKKVTDLEMVFHMFGRSKYGYPINLKRRVT